MILGRTTTAKSEQTQFNKRSDAASSNFNFLG